MSTDLARLPRAATATAVDLGVTLARLPLTVAERVLGRDLPFASPPARAATALQAAVLRAFGTALDDDRLTARAQLLTESLERVAEADRLREQADAIRAGGEEEAAAQLDEAELARRTAAEAAEAQRRRIEAGAEAAADAVDARADRRAQIVDEAAERRSRAARKATRPARTASVAARRAAVVADEEADEAKAVVEHLGDELARAKARRQAR